jgi:hypothetical protein
MEMHFPDGLTNLISVSLPSRKENCAVAYVHPTVFVKADIYKKYGLFNLQYKIAADYDLMIRFFEQGVIFSKINATLTHFKTGGMSTTGAIREDLLKIAIVHKFSQLAIIKQMLLCVYVKITRLIKIIFPFLVYYRRKIWHKQKY